MCSMRTLRRYMSAKTSARLSGTRSARALQRHYMATLQESEDLGRGGHTRVSEAELRCFMCAPRGLVDALGEALGLPLGSAPAAVAEAAAPPRIQQRSAALSERLVARGPDKLAGPGRPLPSDWLLATREEIESQLQTMFAAYMGELKDLILVSVSFCELSTPVLEFRHGWADTVVKPHHARQLWGLPHVLSTEATPWAYLDVGFSVIDGAVHPALARRVREELDGLAAAGALTEHSSSTCNPGSRHLHLRFDTEEARSQMPPALLGLSKALAGLPAALELAASAVECASPGSVAAPRLRLFPMVMAATYGPGSHYVPHLDKYSVGHHGFANTRMLTIICYLNPEWRPGDGGELRLFAQRPACQGSQGSRGGASQGSGPERNHPVPQLLGISADHSESSSATAHDEGRSVDIEPLLGRIVVFRSRDVWHGINELASTRWALTLWVLAEEDEFHN